jgi:hypothetical protein
MILMHDSHASHVLDNQVSVLCILYLSDGRLTVEIVCAATANEQDSQE